MVLGHPQATANTPEGLHVIRHQLSGLLILLIKAQQCAEVYLNGRALHASILDVHHGVNHLRASFFLKCS